MQASRRTVLLVTALVIVTALLAAGVTLVRGNTDQPSRTIRPGLATMYLPIPKDASVTLHSGDERLVDPLTSRSGGLTAVTLPLLWTGSYELRWGSGRMTFAVADPDRTWATLEECAGSDGTADRAPAAVCAAQFIPSMVAEIGPTGARDELLAVSERHPGFGANCDQWAYALAEAVVHAAGVEAAYNTDAQVCRFSYLHGVVIAAALRQYDRDALGTLCATPIKNMDDYARNTQCGHGVGHGALTVSYGDVDEALAWCEGVTEESGARFNCNEGVYMHHQMEVSLVGSNKASELGGEQPSPTMVLPDGCSGEHYDKGNACFRYTMLYALANTPETERPALLQRWNTLCRSLDVSGCWFGIGAAAIQHHAGQIGDPDAPLSLSESDAILAICSDDDELNRTCAMRFLTLSIWTTLDLDAVKPLCAALRARGLDLCTGEELKVWEKMMSQTAAVDPRSHGGN